MKQTDSKQPTPSREVASAPAASRPGPPSGSTWLALQRTAGNQAVVALLRSLRATPSPRKVARLPSPPDCHTRKEGLSGVPDIVKEGYDGSASTTIKSGWSTLSWKRRWQVYDSTDRLVFEDTYTIPEPTLKLGKEIIAAGAAGNGSGPWSVWHKVVQTMVPAGGSDPSNFPHDYVTFNVYETASAKNAAASEAPASDEDVDPRLIPGLSRPTSAANLTPGGAKVSPEVAAAILDNLSRGEPAFKPELGKAGCSWFVTEGNPYVGIDPAKNVPLEVEIDRPGEVITFDETKLDAFNAEVKSQMSATLLEARYRELKKIPPEKALTKKQLDGFERFSKKAVESRMWDRVGEAVRSSKAKVGEVLLKGSKYSRQGDGKFLVVADASRVQVKGGIPEVVKALEAGGAPVEPVLKEAAEAMATKLKWAGRVRSVFRYGGKVLIVVAIAADLYKIYHAKDKTKAVLESVGGWTGASLAAVAFAELWTPADAAGPWAWAAHGVGTLVSGGIGYWIGAGAVRTVYELAVED